MLHSKVKFRGRFILYIILLLGESTDSGHT